MAVERTWRRIAREWIGAVACYAILVAPLAGCPTTVGNLSDIGGIGGFDLTTGPGLFINDDTSSDLILAARNADGDTFFAYGTRTAAGGIDEVESLIVRTAEGEQSFVTFESGRPTHAEAADGSYADIRYTEVSTQRLRASLDLYNAGDGTVQSYEIDQDINLEQTAADIANLVQQVTGREVKTTTLSANNATAKDTGREQSVRITIFNPLYSLVVVPIVAVVASMTIILGQVLTWVFTTAVAAVQAILIAIFTPFFVIADILNSTIVSVRLVPLFDVFVTIPPPPVIVLVDD